MSRILIVEDELAMRTALADVLEDEGYRVITAADGAAGLERAIKEKPDLVLLDIMMPKLDGFAVCAELRRLGHTEPILMLTAKGQVEDRVTGLDVGADDYLVKPFAFEELRARVRSLLRREAARSGSVVVVGDLELDDVRHEARRGGMLLELTAKEFALLRYFMAHAGEVLSQEELLEHVWDEHADPFTNTVRVTVGTLRRKLEKVGAAAPIETVIGRGYRLLDETAEP